MNSSIFFQWIVFGISLCLFASCGSIDDFQEVARQTSPDSVVDAVLFKAGGGGATSGFSYSLFVVEKGASFKKSDDLLFQGDHIKNLRLEWKNDKILEIHYDEARIFQFKNFWFSKDVQNFQYVVEIRLVPSKEKENSLSKEDRFIEGFDMSGNRIENDSNQDTASSKKDSISVK